MFDVALQYFKISALEASLCILVAKMSQGAWGSRERNVISRAWGTLWKSGTDNAV